MVRKRPILAVGRRCQKTLKKRRKKPLCVPDEISRAQLLKTCKPYSPRNATVKRFSDVKYKSPRKGQTPRKHNSCVKRIAVNSPWNKDKPKTPSKSPCAKKAKRSLNLLNVYTLTEHNQGAVNSLTSTCNVSNRDVNIKVNNGMMNDQRHTSNENDPDFYLLSDNDDTNETVSVDPKEDIETEMIDLIPSVMESLAAVGCDKTLLDFFRQVHEGKFPLHNLSFQLWLDVVKWFQCNTTTQMRYSINTKKFWKLGYRLFGGQFINFMSGYKNCHSVVTEEADKGHYSPLNSDVNFAVPDINIIRNFMPYGTNQYEFSETDCEYNSRRPGILSDMIQTLASANSKKSYCITFDGKKLKRGLTKSSGDVDLLGFENEETLKEKRNKLEQTKIPVNYIIDILSECEESQDITGLSDLLKEEMIQILLAELTSVSANILEARELKKKKEYTKEKLIERSGESDWRNGKYVMAISSVIAFIHDIDEFLKENIALLDEINICICCLKESNFIINDSVMNLRESELYKEIEDFDNPTTRQIKQRSNEWFASRKAAKVTGSTIFSALGLDGLARQKDHFDVALCGLPEKPKAESACAAMQHGTENEINAMATLVGKVLPLVSPKSKVFEEGYVEIRTAKDEMLMIVSPDGSIRTSSSEDSTIAAIELKCPVYDIQKRIPERYLLQCLSEIEALNVDNLIYLCWRHDISTVFKVHRNTELFHRAFKLAEDIYISPNPKRPTKLSEESKTLKTDILEACKSAEKVEFIGVFPSLRNDFTAKNSYERGKVLLPRCQLMLNGIIRSHDKFYELKRQPATEAVVFLCCDLDRIWKKDEITSAPVCWFPKGTSLDNATMRRIAESVLDTCHKAGLHIPAVSFDGQWHNISVRSANEEPLTLLQLQKDVWKRVEGMSKKKQLKDIAEMNKGVINIQYACEQADGSSRRYLTCTNGGKVVPRISNSVIVSRKRDLAKVQTNKSAKDQQTSKDCDTEVNAPPVDSDVDAPELSGIVDSSRNAEDVSDNEPYSSGNEHTSERVSIIDTLDMTLLLEMLKADKNCNKKNVWNSKTTNDLYAFFLSGESLRKLREVELRIIVRYLNRILNKKTKESEKKEKKIEMICSLLGIKHEPITTEYRHFRKQTRQPKRLSELAFNRVSQTLRKNDLNIIYAEYLWPDELEMWENNNPIKQSYREYLEAANINSRTASQEVDEDIESTKSKSHKVMETVVATSSSNDVNTSLNMFNGDVNANENYNSSNWFYHPAYSTTRQQIEVSCIDSTHLLTRMRRKSSKGGLDGVTNLAWRQVAKSKRTALSLGMIDCVLEPMSVSVANTHFSLSVENEMRFNGHTEEADLCRDIREWWKAEDDPGLSSASRIKQRLNLRNRLLSYVEFSAFPPPGMHVKGWPVQLWEGVISSIDSKLLLYSLTPSRSYNVRAFSSMMGETFFSELTMYDRRGHGTVTSAEFGQYINSAIEKLQLHVDPSRNFAYCTSRKKVYKPVGKYDEDSLLESEQLDVESDKITIRDHIFDDKGRLRLNAKQKMAKIEQDRNAVERGSLGVRWESARRNESKMLPTYRLGIDLNDH